MTSALKTTLAAAFAAALIAGPGVTLAGDNGGTKLNSDTSATQRLNKNTDMDMDTSTTGSIKCDNSHANIHSGCDKPGQLKQQEHMQDQQ